MKKIQLYLLLSVSILLTLPGFSQSMSNTDNAITLTNTCMNAGVSNGAYTLGLSYYNQDDFSTHTITVGVTVGMNGGVMTITAPGGTFPTPASTTWWSLPDAWPGNITLTSGSFITYMNWYQNPDGTTGFNCVPLPVWFSSFSGIQSGSSVILNWQTQTELTNCVIEIYRSSTGSNYYKIGQVAQGTGAFPRNYSFTDNNPDASDYYYLVMTSPGQLSNYSNTIHVSCSGCHYTPPTPVSCSYTINGPDHICNIESFGAYSLSSAVPNYSTITWSVDQPSVASLRTYPAFDRTKAALLKKGTTGGVTLTATLSGCSNAITKYIAFGTPDPVIDGELFCPQLNLSMSNTPGATTWSWVELDATTGITQNFPNSGWTFGADIGNSDEYAFYGQYTNACGTSNQVVISGYWCAPCGDPCGLDPYVASPNPTTGSLTIALAPDAPQTPAAPGSSSVKGSASTTANAVTKTSPSSATPKAAVKAGIYRVRVIDMKGVVQKNLNYPGGVGNMQVDLSGLKNGVYIIQVFDNKTWKSTKVILAK